MLSYDLLFTLEWNPWTIFRESESPHPAATHMCFWTLYPHCPYPPPQPTARFVPCYITFLPMDASSQWGMAAYLYFSFHLDHYLLCKAKAAIRAIDLRSRLLFDDFQGWAICKRPLPNLLESLLQPSAPRPSIVFQPLNALLPTSDRVEGNLARSNDLHLKNTPSANLFGAPRWTPPPPPQLGPIG